MSFAQNDEQKISSLEDLPSLKIKGLLTEVDSTVQQTLNEIQAFMNENPAAIISITSLFEHEKDITPFWNRSKIIQAHLIEMGITAERLQIKIAKYSEMSDEEIRLRKKGNVIFDVVSFDYKATNN